MEVELTYKMKQNVKYIQCDIGVRDWEDGEVNNETDSFPDEQDEPRMPFACKTSEYEWRWKPLIDIDEGRILNWPKGTTASVYYKVCDDVKLRLLNQNMEEITWYDYYNREMTNEYYGYVPSILECGDEGYGDYVIMDIDGNGKIDCFDKDNIHQIINNEEE